MMNWSTDAFVAEMKRNGLRRAYVTTDKATNTIKVSHPFLEPLAEFLRADKIDYKGHEALFFQLGPQDTLMGAFVWWTNRGQAAGGVRFRPYATFEDYVRDGMRLALGMGRKNALAGLWWGGGKGVCAHPPGELSKDAAYREQLFQEYGRFLTSIQGCYVTAEDSGVTVEDVNNVFKTSRYVTCISSDLGGSGNPSILTSVGVICAMEAALEFLGLGDLGGKSVAIQGIGQVGLPLVQKLFAKGVERLIVAESSEERIAAVRGQIDPRVIIRHVPFGDNSILGEEVDIVSPNAWGGILNEDTIPTIKAKIVCGATNNQLLKSQDDQLMRDRGICYVPDFVANRMGIVNCANEQYGSLEEDPVKLRHFDRSWEGGIHAVTLRVLQEAKASGKSHNETAEALADAAAQQPHPIFPGRNYNIVRAVVSSNWASS